MTKIKTIAFLPLLVSLLIFLGITVSDGIFTLDITGVGSIQYPSEREWREIIRVHQKEIVDGSTDPKFLNACYKGGWRKCILNFRDGHDPWNFEEVLSQRPELLSGNMTDTDRIAGNLGWKDASNALTKRLETDSVANVKSQVHYFNRKLKFALPLIVLSMIVAVIGYFYPKKGKKLID